MIRYKSKKILALILSGVLIAGSVPVTSSAAEISDERMDEVQKGTMESSENTDEDAAQESSMTDQTVLESKPQERVEDSGVEDGKAEEETDAGSKTENDTVEEQTSEEHKSESSAADNQTTEESKTENSAVEESVTEERDRKSVV